VPVPLTLADLVAPVEVSQFFATIQGREHRRFPGPVGRFADVLPWSALGAILHQHRLEFPRLRLALDGEPVPATVYTEQVATRRNGVIPRLQTAPFTEQLRNGATLVLDAVDELSGTVGDLARRLEHDLREKVQVNLYAGSGVTHGFDVHWDDHDAFIIQLAGRKRWRMHGLTRPAPLHRDVEPPPTPATEPIDEFMLEDGDVLYLPRGHWHDVSSVGELSLHLTIGFNPATGVDLVAWLADQLRADELFRRDLPRFAAAQDRTEVAGRLRTAIEAALTPDVVDRFLTDRDAQAPAHPRVGLPWAALPDALPPEDEAEVRLLTPRAVLESLDGDRVALLAAGKRFVFAKAVAPMLEALLDGSPQPIKTLVELVAPAADRERVRGLLAELVKRGLLTVD
jgi:ribosomal protein L16 Arg81 hydroxylase